MFLAERCLYLWNAPPSGTAARYAGAWMRVNGGREPDAWEVCRIHTRGNSIALSHPHFSGLDAIETGFQRLSFYAIKAIPHGHAQFAETVIRMRVGLEQQRNIAIIFGEVTDLL